MNNSHTLAFNRIFEHNKPVKKQKINMQNINPAENMNGIQTDLSKCKYSGNTLYLPNIKEVALINYNELKKALLNAGAAYKRNTFIFPNDAKPYIEKLMNGDKVNLKKEFQYFPTPKKLADEMAAFANITNDNLTVLEPSAGQGAIVKALLQRHPNICVHAYELMDLNRDILTNIKDCIVLGADFLESNPQICFDRIVANPPFSKNQDIKHIRLMYNRLKRGGRIVTLSSTHWQFAQDSQSVEFKAWLDDLGATYENVERGTFKESGTDIETCFIIIDKAA